MDRMTIHWFGNRVYEFVFERWVWELRVYDPMFQCDHRLNVNNYDPFKEGVLL